MTGAERCHPGEGRQGHGVRGENEQVTGMMVMIIIMMMMVMMITMMTAL